MIFTPIYCTMALATQIFSKPHHSAMNTANTRATLFMLSRPTDSSILELQENTVLLLRTPLIQTNYVPVNARGLGTITRGRSVVIQLEETSVSRARDGCVNWFLIGHFFVTLAQHFHHLIVFVHHTAFSVESIVLDGVKNLFLIACFFQLGFDFSFDLL